jgi:hypothetical protein
MFQDFYKRYKSTELQQLDVGVAGSNYPDKVQDKLSYCSNITTIKNQTTE